MEELKMKAFDNRKFYEDQIEFAKKMIGFGERSLERIKVQMKRERTAGKDLVEYVYSKGPLTRIEFEIYGGENFKTVELEKLEKEARRERKSIRKYKAQVARYEAKLAECK